MSMSGAQDLLERRAQATVDQKGDKAIQDTHIHTVWDYIAHYSPYTCEFVGTMLLAFVWSCNSFGFAAAAGPWKPLCLGLALSVMTYSFASISGAQFNPAVALAVGFAGKGDWHVVYRKGIVQFLGCALGVGISVAMFGKPAGDYLGARPPHAGQQPVFAVETIYTFMLCFVYLNCLCSRAGNPVTCGNQFFGMGMGFAMVASAYAALDVSGAVFNPALATVIWCMHVGEFGTLLAYITAHFCGAFLAALFFRAQRPAEDDSYKEWLTASAHEGQMGITKLKAFSEAVGTWMFVYTIGMTQLSQQFASAQPLAGGAVYVCMNYALADVSGGYFNPAVTLSVMMSCRKRCSLIQGTCYIIVQTASACLAALAYAHVAHAAVPVVTSSRVGAAQVCVAELLFMNFTCFAVLACVTTKGITTRAPRNFYHGLVYGLSYAAGGFATYSLTHGVLNPALSIGMGIANHVSKGPSAETGFFWRRCLSMAVFEFGGAIFANVLFRLTYGRLYRQDALAAMHDDLEEKGEGQPLTSSDGSRKALPLYGISAPEDSVGG